MEEGKKMSMPDNGALLEALDACIDHIEEQDKTIDRLMSITKRQAEDIEQLKTIAGCEDLTVRDPG